MFSLTSNFFSIRINVLNQRKSKNKVLNDKQKPATEIIFSNDPSLKQFFP